MAQALPIHIVNEIERRWQRRFDVRPPSMPGKSHDCSAGLCPLDSAAESTEPAIPGDAVADYNHVCSGYG
jgi:hypothetical protein